MSHITASVGRKTKSGMSDLLAQSHPGIRDRVSNVGEDQTEDIERGAEENHRADNRKVLIIDCVDRVAAETWNAEEAFHDKRPHEEKRDHGNGRRDDRERRIPENVEEENPGFGHSFRARCSHVILSDLLEEHRAV